MTEVRFDPKRINCPPLETVPKDTGPPKVHRTLLGSLRNLKRFLTYKVGKAHHRAPNDNMERIRCHRSRDGHDNDHPLHI